MSRIEYIDSVVEYHQFRDELGLSVAEARTNPDTLAVFQELTQTVADSPELVAAYTGVLRSRGARKKEAIEKVRSIESDILIELSDVEAITEAKKAKEEAKLQTDEEIAERAKRFVKLFKQVIPSEQLPKRKKPTKKKAGSEAGDIHEEVRQDTFFRVEIDQDDTILINGKTPKLNHPQHVLLHLLLAEPDTEAFLTRSYITTRPAWKKLVAENGADPKLLFTQSIGKLRKHLKTIGLEGFIETDGERRHMGYRANVHAVKYEERQNQPAQPKPQTQAPARRERRKGIEPSETVLTSEKFALKLLNAIHKLEAGQAEHGLRLAKATRFIAQGLGIERDQARKIISQFEDTEQLFVGGAKKGNRHVSSSPIGKDETNVEKGTNKAEAVRWTPEDEKAVGLIVEKMLELKSVSQGRGIKKFWESDVQGLIDEKRFKYLVRQLEKIGILEIRRDANLNRGSWRAPKVSVMRLASSDVRERLKEDRTTVIDELRTFIQKP